MRYHNHYGRDSVQFIQGGPFDPLQEKVQHLTWGCKHVPVHVPVQQALMLVERLACHCTLCFCCKCLGAYSPGSLQKCPVLQVTVVLQELTSSQASSNTQAFSCRSRPSGLLPVPTGVSGGLHHGALLCHSHFKS